MGGSRAVVSAAAAAVSTAGVFWALREVAAVSDENDSRTVHLEGNNVRHGKALAGNSRAVPTHLSSDRPSITRRRYRRSWG